MMTITAQEIIDSCPTIYRNFGTFQCYKGWFELIYKYSLILEDIAKDPKFEIPPRVVQVKEKFGGLRIYMRGWDNELLALCGEAEKESYDICEACGSKDTVSTHGSGWLKTLCKDCDHVPRN